MFNRSPCLFLIVLCLPVFSLWLQWATIKGSVSGLVTSVKSLAEENAALKRAAAFAEADDSQRVVAVAGNARQRTQFAPALASTSDDQGSSLFPQSISVRSVENSPILRAAAGASLPSLDRRTMARAGSSRRTFDSQSSQVRH